MASKIVTINNMHNTHVHHLYSAFTHAVNSIIKDNLLVSVHITAQEIIMRVSEMSVSVRQSCCK